MHHTFIHERVGEVERWTIRVTSGDVADAHAIVGLFWAIRLWLEREAAWLEGAEDPFALYTCNYSDCGHRRR